MEQPKVSNTMTTTFETLERQAIIASKITGKSLYIDCTNQRGYALMELLDNNKTKNIFNSWSDKAALFCMIKGYIQAHKDFSLTKPKLS